MIDWVEAWFHPECSLGASSDYNLANTALPIWATLIVVELAASNFLGKKLYSLRQSISNLSSGLLMLTFMGERAGGGGGGWWPEGEESHLPSRRQ